MDSKVIDNKWYPIEEYETVVPDGAPVLTDQGLAINTEYGWHYCDILGRMAVEEQHEYDAGMKTEPVIFRAMPQAPEGFSAKDQLNQEWHEEENQRLRSVLVNYAKLINTELPEAPRYSLKGTMKQNEWLRELITKHNLIENNNE